MLFAELAAEGGTLLLVRTAVERLDGGLTLAEVAAMRARDAKAAAVMGDAVPWYSVMVHLGRPELQTEGVWLRSILLRSDKKVELCGAALSYAALSVFLQSFEADRAFFPQGPVLEASEEGKDAEKNRIAFRISIGI